MAKAKKNPRAVSPADARMGERIRLRRIELAMSQGDLGEKLGVSFQQVQKYEKGVNRVSAVRMEQLTRVLDVTPGFFFDATNDEVREVESILFLDSKFSIRMLRAYSRVKDRSVAHQLVVLMEGIAG